MSKQMDAKVFLTPQQFELSKTLYMQWLRDASNLIKLPTRESPRKKVKVEQSKVEQGRALFRGATTQAAEAARHQGDSFDAMQDEIERWERIAADEIDKYRAANGLLNEFKMAWDLRDRFPLHFIVLKQTAVHLPHEANVEQIFSRAGYLLTDPNIDQEYLATLVVVGCNKKAFKPSCDAIKAKYYQLFRGKGGEGLEEVANEQAEGDAGAL